MTQAQQVDLTLQHLEDYVLSGYAQASRTRIRKTEGQKEFSERLDVHFPNLMYELDNVYGSNEAVLPMLKQLVTNAWKSYSQRGVDLKAVSLSCEENPDWLLPNRMVGGACYVDLFAGDLKSLRERIPYFRELGLTYLHMMSLFKYLEGKSGGGYATSGYRGVNPVLGTINDLREVIGALYETGVSTVVDFIFSRISNERGWAKGCVDGDPRYDDFYYIFPDRWVPDQCDRTLRGIFPDQHPGGFSQLEDGRWVWTTFNSFQWDLNYTNPWVFNVMADEMIFLVSLSVDILRMDAVAFIWKQMGTSYGNLPQAHALIRALSSVMCIATLTVFFRSEAVACSDEVAQYIHQNECRIGCNPLQMALLWNTLATREANSLQRALTCRHNLPEHTGWVSYVRSYDDIGRAFTDEDTSQFGIQGYNHCQFLNRFSVNHFDDSFVRGVPFQYNPNTGDYRISGTAAAPAGLTQNDPYAADRIKLLYSAVLSAGGLPLTYLGSEVGTLNDDEWAGDSNKSDDSHWTHRLHYNETLYGQRNGPSTSTGKIYQGLRRVIQIHQNSDKFDGDRLNTFNTNNVHVLSYTCNHALLVLANFSEDVQTIGVLMLSAMPEEAFDLISDETVSLHEGVTLRPYQVLWLKVA